MSLPAKPRKAPPAAEKIVREQLAALSDCLEETAAQYVKRLQREISDVLTALTSSPVKKLQRMTELLTKLQAKPQKGRRKDLKKIDELIGELERLTEEK